MNGALEAHEAALDIAKKLAASDPTNADWQHDLGATHLLHGDVVYVQRKFDQALKKYQKALAIFDQLVSADPRQAFYRFALAETLERIGDVQLDLRHAEDALDSYHRKRGIATELVAEDGTNGEWQRGLLIAHVKYAEALQAKESDAGGILDSYSKALVVAQEMQIAGRLNPADTWMIANLQKRVAKWKVLKSILPNEEEK